MWDEADGLYYDKLVTPDGTEVPVKVRSMVGIIPLLAAVVVDEDVIARSRRSASSSPGCSTTRGLGDLRAARRARPAARRAGRAPASCSASSASIACSRLFEKLFDEDEFLSPYGLRAVSAYHREHPYELDVEGITATIDYEPAESTTAMFGGNSNWRGPLWFPLNYLVVSALERYHRFFGDDFQVEYPTGSGTMLPLDKIADDLRRRLVSLFLVGADGRRPSLRRWSSACRPTRRGRTTSSSTSTSTATTAPGSARRTRRAGPASSPTSSAAGPGDGVYSVGEVARVLRERGER